MKERGMIFNGEMVRAILDGRKTQTRRVVKAADGAAGFHKEWDIKGEEIFVVLGEKDHTGMNPVLGALACPHGAVGDRIWVRETWQGPLVDFERSDDLLRNPEKYEKPKNCVYKADGVPAPEFFDADDNLRCCWRPSIHMPRWASRITLEITGVRAERLNSISEEDAKAEGMELTGWRPTYSDPDSGGEVWTPYDNFAQLWESIYGEGSWKENPWVWVIEFKRMEASDEQ
jgi:hypothetical protein